MKLHELHDDHPLVYLMARKVMHDIGLVFFRDDNAFNKLQHLDGFYFNSGVYHVMSSDPATSTYNDQMQYSRDELERTTSDQIANLNTIKAPMVSIDTALAINTIRQIDIQLLVLKASLVGSETRIAGYQELVKRLD